MQTVEMKSRGSFVVKRRTFAGTTAALLRNALYGIFI